MKKNTGLFIVILFLFSACLTPLASQSKEKSEIQKKIIGGWSERKSGNYPPNSLMYFEYESNGSICILFPTKEVKYIVVSAKEISENSMQLEIKKNGKINNTPYTDYEKTLPLNGFVIVTFLSSDKMKIQIKDADQYGSALEGIEERIWYKRMVLPSQPSGTPIF